MTNNWITTHFIFGCGLRSGTGIQNFKIEMSDNGFFNLIVVLSFLCGDMSTSVA